jgi:hypothetical protein
LADTVEEMISNMAEADSLRAWASELHKKLIKRGAVDLADFTMETAEVLVKSVHTSEFSFVHDCPHSYTTS